MPKLTKRVVDAAEPSSSKDRSFLWDTQARGFGLMIMRSDVARFQQDVADGKTAADQKTGFRGRAIVVGGKGIAARSVSTLSAMLQFAVGRGLIPNNPARGVKLFAYVKRQTFLNYEQVV